MGWLVLPIAALMVAMGISVGSFVGAGLSLILGVLTIPPLWKALRDRGHSTYAAARWASAAVISIAALAFNSDAYSKSPEGIAAEARRVAKEQAQADKANSNDMAQQDAAGKDEKAKIANGTHCVNGWDDSFPPLKDAVKERLRNPRSFEHIQTSWSRTGKDGKFGLVMKYRAQNGFGGLNAEAVGVLVDARTCDFKEVTAATLAKRALDDPATS